MRLSGLSFHFGTATEPDEMNRRLRRPPSPRNNSKSLQALAHRLRSDEVSEAAECPLLMLWTAPPPAHECHGCGRC